MCGIAGFIDKRLYPSKSAILIKEMMESIVHRGPDGTNYWNKEAVTLGHNRLAIIDLSNQANQPMFHQQYTLVFNGEIYNYLELKAEMIAKGCNFKTQSDTEVILQAYAVWGEDCVNHFIGMWAFALWDDFEQKLFCSRDRFAIKPFYFISSQGAFYFASEKKALKFTPVFDPTLNLKQLSRGQQLTWTAYKTETYFQHVQQIPAAHNLVWKAGVTKMYQYWDLQESNVSSFSHQVRINQFRELFLNSIDLHLRSDVEVGGCLSGEIDSSSIASVIGSRYAEKEFKSFTIYYEGKDAVDERPWVNEVLNAYPSINNYTYSPQNDELSEAFINATYYHDIPVMSSSVLSQYFVMQMAKKNKMKVLLDGQGSDEYLGGYFHSFYRLAGAALNSGSLVNCFNELNSHKKQQHFGISKTASLLSKSFLSTIFNEQTLYNFEYQFKNPKGLVNGIGKPFEMSNKFSDNKLSQFLYNLTFTTSLPSLLQFEDRNSSAFSIESRVPFLDHRLVEMAFSFSNKEKIHNGITKYVLRESMRGILPNSIVGRKDKKGFVTPGETLWLRGNLKWLLEENITLDYINKKVAKAEIEKFKKGDNSNAAWLWRLVSLNYWSKTI